MVFSEEQLGKEDWAVDLNHVADQEILLLKFDLYYGKWLMQRFQVVEGITVYILLNLLAGLAQLF